MKAQLLLGAVAALTFAGSALAQEAGTQTPEAAAAGIPAAAWRTVAPENLLVIDTSRGRILVEMAPEIAPRHVERVRRLARDGFYDNQRFHRVIDWFMAQTGDPLSRGGDRALWGEGQSAYPDLDAEFTFRRAPEMAFAPVSSPMGSLEGFIGSLPIMSQPDELMSQTGDGKVHGWATYCPGVAGMARDEDNNSANSQFFIMRQAYPSLDKRYTVWGRAIVGLDVVRALSHGTDPSGAVAEPDMMTRVQVAADIPEAERPTVRILSTGSQTFRDLVDQVRAARGADFSLCDIDLPAEVS
ncbi:MAG TPA: peptidylprolyl isomerase [Brevundimonas sp.]|jgi:peptidylprolyl isomerase|uniref:peptidylprolyl isomerase n=1 Tax=Brevundimonas sp. TaxID=1871086 RepID=UPI002C239EEA|nr:peptidylprolyl isomerase [Brevundimonas sp.]HRH19780.1 peptidylprolyl isomerase [Brevundimonas sp.]